MKIITKLGPGFLSGLTATGVIQDKIKPGEPNYFDVISLENLPDKKIKSIYLETIQIIDNPSRAITAKYDFIFNEYNYYIGEFREDSCLIPGVPWPRNVCFFPNDKTGLAQFNLYWNYGPEVYRYFLKIELE